LIIIKRGAVDRRLPFFPYRTPGDSYSSEDSSEPDSLSDEESEPES